MDEYNVTVVIPAFNSEKYIADALFSIENQRYKAKEVVVVLNGCTDETEKVCEEYRENSDINIVIIKTEYANLSNARNIGFSLARSNYIAILDADDVYDPSFLEKAAEAFSEKPNIAVFFGNRYHFNNSGITKENFLENTECNKIKPSLHKSDIRYYDFSISEYLLNGNFISCSGAVLNKQKAFSTGLFSTRLKHTEDREFFVRLLSNNCSACTFSITHGYRVHDSSISKNLCRSEYFSTSLRILKSFKELCLPQSFNLKLNNSISEARFNLLHSLTEEGKQVFKNILLADINLGKKFFLLLKFFKRKIIAN